MNCDQWWDVTFTSLHYLSSLFGNLLVMKYILGEITYQVYNRNAFRLMRITMALYRPSSPYGVAVVCFALELTSWHQSWHMVSETSQCLLKPMKSL